MKEVIIMSREEYKGIYNEFNKLKEERDDAFADCMVLQDHLESAHRKIKNLWEALNRPAIEDMQKEHDKEYYTWCEQIAAKYERLDWNEFSR